MRRLVILLSIFAVAPLLHPLYFWGAHDGRHSVYFLVEFDRSIQDGILWPRWAPDFAFGYGYPIFNIYAPLAYFLAEAIHLVGFDFVVAVKIVFAMGFVLSGLSMYWFARDTLGARGALVAAVVYMYVPYRLVDVYVRGALSESLAFVFLPLMLGSFRRLLGSFELRVTLGKQSPSPIGPATVSALATAALILTHNSMSLVFLPIAAAFVGWHLLRMLRGIRSYPQGAPSSQEARSASGVRVALPTVVPAAAWSLGAAAIGICLSAVFWLPTAAEYADVRTDQWTTADYAYSDNFVYLHQFVSPFWGYGTSRPGPDDEMPFQLGVAPLGLAILGLVGSRRSGVTADRAFFFVVAVASSFLMLPISEPVWRALRIASLVQFPWRLLAVTTLATAYLAGLSAVGDDERAIDRTADARDRLGTAALLLAVLFGSYSLLNPPMIQPAEGPVSLGALMRFEQSSGELVGLTRWNKVKPNDSPLKPIYEAGDDVRSKVDRSTVPEGAVVETVRHTTILDEIHIQTADSFTLGLYSQFYPGWKAYLDGTPVAITPAGDLGLQTIDIPSGEHVLLVQFEDTPPRVIGMVISLATAAGLIAVHLVRRLRRRNGPTSGTDTGNRPMATDAMADGA